VENRPPYAIASVDSALLLATLLQQEGPMRVTDAAERLGVSASTAHRLLGMLVHRDSAEQLPDRRYGPGRVRALPHLRRLVDQLGETTNLMVLTGPDVRFVATVECEHVLRVGDRTGRSLPAHLTSGGKALLAALPPDDLDVALAQRDDETAARLRRELPTIRRQGFAVNDQDTEAGLTAVGVAIPDGRGAVAGAISVSMPTVRYSRDRLRAWSAALAAAAAAIAADLDAV
jgi:IclR family transcriptional regulator, acetate operon repressor